jgi:hypothetical protein
MAHDPRSGRSPATSVLRIAAAVLLVGIPLVVLFNLANPVPESRPASRRTQCLNNIRNIGLSVLEYAGANHDQLPPAYQVDKAGRPMHSWRALTLGYMDQMKLARQYRLDEPWNGPHNSTFSHVELGELHCPDDPGARSDASYMVVVGPRTAFPGAKSRPLAEIEKGDGTQNTLLVVEVANSGVPWVEPRDVRFEDAIRGVNVPGVLGISSRHDGFVMGVFADGHAVAISDKTDPKVLERLLLIDDGGPAKFP